MIDFLKRTWADINLDAIRHNYAEITKILSPGCSVMAIVKADAYGHGAGIVSRTLKEAGVSWFGVSNLDEAMQIRNEGLDNPILILSYTQPDKAAQLAKYNIAQSVFDRRYAERLGAEAVKAGVTVRVHVKLDTGMSRLGFFCPGENGLQKTIEDITAVCSLPGLYAEGVFTHFASADEREDGGYTQMQFELFCKVVGELEKRGIKFPLRHCCNSAAAMRFPKMHLDLARIGIALYGLYPAPWMKEIIQLSPAMELKATVSMLKTIPAGTAVSYGRTYKSKGVAAVATVPIGYADGYPRNMSNRAEMIVCGKRAKVIGRVCMDQSLLDVTGIDGVDENSVVAVIGRDGGEMVSVDEISELSGTINYEIVCLIGKRVPRVYHSGGKLIGQLNYIRMQEELL
jgi:alanine racemase